MYTKEQVSKIRQRFWTVFGQYMKPVPGAGGNAVNWLNYKTGVRQIVFKMEVDSAVARIEIQLRHVADAERAARYNQFLSLKNLLEQITGFEWNWEPSTQDENGTLISRIGRRSANVNILNESDWPAIIGFLKTGIVALDAFWIEVKDAFEN